MRLETKPRNWFKRIEGYLLIPHELLHVVGYRLVGQRSIYYWGETYVTPVPKPSRAQDLFGMLFPFTVFLLLALGFGLLAGFASRAVVEEGASFWFVFWLGLTYTAGLYAGTTLGDLRRAYLSLRGQPWYSWTPFDFFFYPLVDWDEIRRRIERRD
jgi:hypothetical protein